MNRRGFLVSGGVAAFSAILPHAGTFARSPDAAEPFEWKTNDLMLPFEVTAGKLRQKRLVPADALALANGRSSGVEVALQCSGENSPDQGMKSIIR